MAYEVYQNRKNESDIVAFYFENDEILYYTTYNISLPQDLKRFKRELSLFRLDFSPIKMEWRNNLLDDIWVDFIGDYKKISSLGNWKVIEDGKWVFFDEMGF